MSQDTTLLLGLDGLAAERVEIDADGCPVVHVVTADPEAARCPACRVVSTSPKQWVFTHPRDVPYGGRMVRLSWRKRRWRWRCRNPDCGKGSFTEQAPAAPARSRLTARLREQAGAALADRGATVAQTCRDLGVSWPTVTRSPATPSGCCRPSPSRLQCWHRRDLPGPAALAAQPRHRRLGASNRPLARRVRRHQRKSGPCSARSKATPRKP